MQIRTLVYLILSSLTAVLLSACATTGTTPVEATNSAGVEATNSTGVEARNSAGSEMVKSAENQQPRYYRFYPGDELSIVASRPELAVALTRVDPYGYINYPYLGQVSVKNLTTQEVSERLVRGLQEGDYYKRIELRVSFVNAKTQYVHVMGEVKKPGPVPITGSITLLEALGAAGGETHDAELSTVLWIRGSQSPPGVVKLDLKAVVDHSSGKGIPNFELIPGDVIYIPDSVIASIQRFFVRVFDIMKPFIALENGIVLYDSTERVLSGRYPDTTSSSTTVFVNPLGR